VVSLSVSRCVIGKSVIHVAEMQEIMHYCWCAVRHDDAIAELFEILAGCGPCNAWKFHIRFVQRSLQSAFTVLQRMQTMENQFRPRRESGTLSRNSCLPFVLVRRTISDQKSIYASSDWAIQADLNYVQ
jgi:hypothetical protein